MTEDSRNITLKIPDRFGGEQFETVHADTDDRSPSEEFAALTRSIFAISGDMLTEIGKCGIWLCSPLCLVSLIRSANASPILLAFLLPLALVFAAVGFKAWRGNKYRFDISLRLFLAVVGICGGWSDALAATSR